MSVERGRHDRRAWPGVPTVSAGAGRGDGTGRKPEPWRYQIDLQQLDILTRIIETGSFSKAAAAVYLTQPTVSAHIATLERTLGLKLLDRLGRQTRPTTAGRTLYSYAKKMLALRSQAVEEVDLLLGLVRGSLQLAGSSVPGTYVLPIVIGGFKERHPEVTISLRLGDSDSVVDLVATGEAEVGLVGARPKDSDVASEPFGEDQLVLVAAPAHPIGRASRIAARDLKGVSFLSREPGSGTQRFAEDALRRAGIDTADLSILCHLGSSEAMREAARAGIGAAFLSRRAVEADLQSGRLREIEVDGLKLRRPFHLIRPKRRSISPLGNAFCEFLKTRGPDGRRA